MRTLPLIPLLFLATTAAAQTPPDVSVLRVAPPAKLIAKKTATLLPGKTVAVGSRVSTGAAGRAALQIGGGVLTVGGDSELYLHSTASGGSADIARLVLSRGALRAQVARSAAPALDLRLNVGALRLRALGADIWAAVEPRGETVCLIDGAVEIAAEFGSEVLQQPGDCLFFSAQNRRLVLKPDGAETLARKLERTAFATDVAMGLPAAAVPTGPRSQIQSDDPELGSTPITPPPSSSNNFEIVSALPPPSAPPPEPAPATVISDEPYEMPPPETPAPPAAPPQYAPPVVAATPPPAAPPPLPPEIAMEPAMALANAIADEPAPGAAAPSRASYGAPPVSGGRGWYVVVASPGVPEGAAAHAAKLQKTGVNASVRSADGKHRVVVGPYASKGEAGNARNQLQYQLKANGLWLLEDK